MRWSYKTVHFELKKEGLLGAGFLDETEIEQELNDFGRSGWELISVLEVQDGIIAFFKQPVERPSSYHKWTEEPEEKRSENSFEEDKTEVGSFDSDEDIVHETAEDPEDFYEAEANDEPPENHGIGAIKIE